MGSISVDQLSNRQVISIAEGERLGVVRDFLIDPVARSVAGVIVGGDKGEVALLFGKIVRVGPDAVMVAEAADAQPVAQASPEGVRRFSELSKLAVMSTDGVQLGNVADLDFDLQAGIILSVEVRTGGVLGIGQQKTPISVEKVKSFGTSAITVDTGTAGE